MKEYLISVHNTINLFKFFPLDIPTDEDSMQDEFTLHPLNTKDKLDKYWSNALKTLDVFWGNWKNDLSSLRVILYKGK